MKHKRSTKIEKIQEAVSAVLAVTTFFAPLFACAQIPSEPLVPKIISRSYWGADESQETVWPMEYAKVEKFIVHHTASSQLIPDSDGSGEYKSMVKNIYTYQKDSKSWYDDNGENIGFGDIGYNYLIDPNGNIYEGRYGGNGVIGGHTRSYNEGSVGIAVIGTYGGNVKNEYTSHAITSQITASLEKLIGWLAANNSADLNKTSDFKGKSIDGVVGHRDLGATICPGNELYKQLDGVQTDAAGYAGGYKNYAYQIGGDKAVYVLEDGYKMKFDSSEKLPPAYQNKIVKPISKSQLDAYKYRNIVIYPDGSLLKEFDNPMVYYLENGLKRAMNMSGEEFKKMGFNSEDIKQVFASDLKMYGDGKAIKYGPDGKLAKDKNENVYLVENGKKRKFTSPRLFEYLKYKWKDATKDDNIDFYLGGLDMIYPDGTLIAGGSGQKIYLIENRQRREISSDSLLGALGYKKENAVSATQDELNHFPVGEKMTYPDNSLIKADNSPVVYLVKSGKRKEFTSAVLFEKLGYKWNNIISVRADEISNHPPNGKVPYPDGTLIKSAGDPNVYFLEEGKKRKITSLALFEKKGFKWNNVVSVGPDELTDYPDGKILTYPDGTLIKKENSSAVYRIENGERKEFTSLALFDATKSKWSEVITVSGEELSAYAYGGVARYPENALLRPAGGSKVYVMKSGKAEWVKTADEFKKAKYKWQDIIEVSQYEMNLYLQPQENKPPQAEEQKPEVENSGDSGSTSAKNSGNESNGNIGTVGDTNDTNNATSGANNTASNANNTISNAGDTNNTTDTAEDNPNIRIAIYSTTGDKVIITANGNYAVNYYNSDGTIQKTENKSSNEQTEIPYFNSSLYVKFTPSSPNAILQVLSYDDLSWNKAANDNEFRGSIEIRYSNVSGRLWVINELPLEDYVNGIAEALNDSPEEYLKAFGTIARTYAINYIKRGGKHSGEPFHLKNSRNGNGNDQVYKGYNFEKRAPKIIAANKSTQGYVITYNGKPIVAAYSSDSGGTAKNGCEVLGYCGDEYAYLKGGANDPSDTEHNPDKVSASHGVGMSAVGGYQMAVNGSSWREIIKHYYPGVEIIN